MHDLSRILVELSIKLPNAIREPCSEVWRKSWARALAENKDFGPARAIAGLDMDRKGAEQIVIAMAEVLNGTGRDT